MHKVYKTYNLLYNINLKCFYQMLLDIIILDILVTCRFKTFFFRHKKYLPFIWSLYIAHFHRTTKTLRHIVSKSPRLWNQENLSEKCYSARDPTSVVCPVRKIYAVSVARSSHPELTGCQDNTHHIIIFH